MRIAQHHNMEYQQVLKELRKEDQSVLSRVQSILYDAKYVHGFSRFPLVANERCGLWYVRPSEAVDSAYFKSSDGHCGQWMFSLRRLNLHLLPLFHDSGVLVLVDSTKKGKLMPDAMSKTVPIWCAVLNYIMFEDEPCERQAAACKERVSGEQVSGEQVSGEQVSGEQAPEEQAAGKDAAGKEAASEKWAQLRRHNWLATPSAMVSDNEHWSIVERIPQHAAAARKLGLVSKQALVQKLGARKPLIPHWVYPGKATQSIPQSHDYFTVCCLTASIKASAHSSLPGWNHVVPYIQGAADDHELWVPKDVCEGALDHKLLWDHIYTEKSPELSVVDRGSATLHTWLTEKEFVDRINGIHQNSKQLRPGAAWQATALGSTGIIFGKINGPISRDDVKKAYPSISSIIVMSEKYAIVDVPEKCSEFVFSACIPSNKKGSKKLRETLPEILRGLGLVSSDKSAIVLCDTGSDISVAVVLCILCRFFDLDWVPTASPPHVNKDVIKQHLHSISNYRKCNPSRNTLQSVNTCLI